MRTTITIDDDVLDAARDLAEREGTSLGKAVSELARRGCWVTPASTKDGVFVASFNAPPITSEDVYRALDEVP